MSRREAKVIAVAGALQAKSFDLTKYRQRSLAERRLTLRPEVAAGMLAFGAMNVTDAHGDVRRGDPLPGLLLELKVASHVNLDRYTRALALLVHRHGGLMKDADTVRAVAGGALFEWLNDQCSQCRGAREGSRQPRACRCTPLVDQNSVGGRYYEVQSAKGPIQALTSRPEPGCPKCRGTGRVFSEAKERRGMLCAHCGNSGRIDFKARDRWLFVSDHLKQMQRAQGETPKGIKRDQFSQHWMRRYMRFLDVLREIERRLGTGLDMGWEANMIQPIEPDPQEEQDREMVERGVSDSPTSQEPEEPSDESPPKES